MWLVTQTYAQKNSHVNERYTQAHTAGKPTTKCQSSIQSNSPETQTHAVLSQDRES